MRVGISPKGNKTFVKSVVFFLERLNSWIEGTAYDLSIPYVNLAEGFRDPARPLFLDERWSCGDHAHLNVDGYKRMAEILYKDYFEGSPGHNVVVCLGDSLTQGFPGRSSIERNGFPVRPENDNQSQYPFWLTKLSGQTFINRGIAGNTVYGMRSRFDKEVVIHLPDHCVILGGTNDALSP